MVFNFLLVPPPSPPPPEVQALCSFVVWYTPEVSCDGISGYDVRLYHPRSAQQNMTRRVGANGTFYIVKDEDRLVNDHDTHVQVAICMYVCQYRCSNIMC